MPGFAATPADPSRQPSGHALSHCLGQWRVTDRWSPRRKDLSENQALDSLGSTWNGKETHVIQWSIVTPMVAVKTGLPPSTGTTETRLDQLTASAIIGAFVSGGTMGKS